MSVYTEESHPTNMAAAETEPEFDDIFDDGVDVRAAVRHFVDYWTGQGFKDPLNDDYESTLNKSTITDWSGMDRTSWPLRIAYMENRRDVIDALLNPELGDAVARVTYHNKYYDHPILTEGHHIQYKDKWANLPAISPPVGPYRRYWIKGDAPLPEYVRFLIENQYTFDRHEYLTRYARSVREVHRYWVREEYMTNAESDDDVTDPAFWETKDDGGEDEHVAYACSRAARVLIQNRDDAEFWYGAVNRVMIEEAERKGVIEEPGDWLCGRMAVIMRAKYGFQFRTPAERGLVVAMGRMHRENTKGRGIGGGLYSAAQAIEAYTRKHGILKSRSGPPLKRQRTDTAAPFPALHI